MDKMQRVAFIRNKYYFDDGMEYTFMHLRSALSPYGIELFLCGDSFASYPPVRPDFAYAVFWDKDTTLGFALERVGVTLINRARTVELCDDKQKTYSAVYGKVAFPETLCAPLVYDVCDGQDERLLTLAERTLGYPMIVKENVGSQGRQVYLAHDRIELKAWHEKTAHVPHLFQRFVRASEESSDIRVYLVGGKAVGAVRRTNTVDFRSNTAQGGRIERISIPPELTEEAEKVGAVLGLDFGTADFMEENGKFLFIEANSSAYTQNAERNGIPLTELFAQHIAKRVLA
ncbi:MAG: RimK family alpha-L-glutamate ligase [Clostridiales bacterium]|nr:RimK family alpha-L-glutamate ligase [Clostridiales bacterium]